MPRYKFKWENLPDFVLSALQSPTSVEPLAEELQGRYGARPKADFVKGNWPALLDGWLSHDSEAAVRVAATLAENGSGDESLDRTTHEGALSFLRSCRNTSGLQRLVLGEFIALGEATHSPHTAARPAERPTTEAASSEVPDVSNHWPGVVAGHSDPGVRAIALLYEDLQIDDAWAVAGDRSFTWWAYRLPQTIEADLPIPGPDGALGACVRICTQVVVDIPTGSDILGLLSVSNLHASLSATVFDERSGVISEVATAHVYADTVESWHRMLATAAVLQNAAAHSHAHALAEAVGGRVAESAHPTSGIRPEMDEMLNVPEQVIASQGRNPSGFAGPLVAGLASLSLPFLILADDGGANVEIPFSSSDPAFLAAAVGQPVGTALLRVDPSQPHPELGSGALLTLTLPPILPMEPARQWATYLNLLEATQPTGTTLLGAWCAVPSPDDRASLVFVTFVPNTLASSGVLENLTVYNAVRTEWAHDVIEGAADA